MPSCILSIFKIDCTFLYQAHLPEAPVKLDYYQQNSKQLVERYDSLSSDDVHAAWLEHLPEIPGRALDIGAGSGRDARWLTTLGWQVTAVEPCNKLREFSQTNSPDHITWLNDTLPNLYLVINQSFDLILISAVWMHLDQKEQVRAYQRVSKILSKNGLLVITWRNPAGDTHRHFESVDETILRDATIITSNDKGGRHEVKWKSAIIRKTAK
jgi:SAM-dependent methyltransferase